MTRLDKEIFLTTFDSLRETLKVDPLFEPESVQELKNTFRKLRQTYESFFELLYSLSEYPELPGDPYGGPQIIYGALRIAQKAITDPPENRTIEGNFDHSPEDEEDKVFFHHGDLTINGSAWIGYGALIITGNLTVNGVMIDNESQTLVVVGGNLTVENLVTEGPIIVCGDLTASGLIYGVYNDYFLNVGGKIQASVLIEDDHPTLALKGKEARYLFEAQDIDDRADELRALLLPELFEDIEGLLSIDVGALISHLTDGVPIFQPSYLKNDS